MNSPPGTAQECVSEATTSLTDQLHGLCKRLGRIAPNISVTQKNGTLYTCDVHSGTKTLGSATSMYADIAQSLALEAAIGGLEAGENETTPEKEPPKKKRAHVHRKDRLRERRARKRKRGGAYGRAFEKTVTGYLSEMTAEGLLAGFVYHEPNSEEDQAGKDFTVQKDGRSISFGVTISRQSAMESRAKHPGIAIFHFPHNTKPETVKKRVLELFD